MGKSTRFAIDYGHANISTMPKPNDQSQKFKEAAHELDCDPDERNWEERLRKVAKQKLDSESSGSVSRK